MRYLCLVYYDEAGLEALPERERAAAMSEARAYREELRQSGRSIISGELKPGEAAATIRVLGREVSISEGPGAGAMGRLGGFYLISATDLNDAIRVAARMPPAGLGCIEVRPLSEGGERRDPP